MHAFRLPGDAEHPVVLRGGYDPDMIVAGRDPPFLPNPVHHLLREMMSSATMITECTLSISAENT